MKAGRTAILDCESRQSTVTTVADAFGCTGAQLSEFLQGIDLSAIYEQPSVQIPPEEYLLERATQRFGEPSLPTAAAWFHRSRVLEDTDFADGLLPLDQSLPRLWATLESLAPSEAVRLRLKRMQEHGVDDFQYNFKVGVVDHRGPYGHLVRQEALRHYGYWPEIMEDIFNGYERKYRESLVVRYERALKPCVVKFKAECEMPSGCLMAALSYARVVCRREGLDAGCSYAFDGGGRTIPRSSLLKIEFVAR